MMPMGISTAGETAISLMLRKRVGELNMTVLLFLLTIQIHNTFSPFPLMPELEMLSNIITGGGLGSIMWNFKRVDLNIPN